MALEVEDSTSSSYPKRIPMQYSFQCESCKRVDVAVVRVDDRDNSILCPACGGDMSRQPGLDFAQSHFVIPRNFHTSASEIFPKGVPKGLMPAPEAKGGRLDNARNTGNLKYVPGMDFKR